MGDRSGQVRVVVRRGGVESFAMSVIVQDANPNRLTHDGSNVPRAQSAAGRSTPAAGPAGDSTSRALGGPDSSLSPPARSGPRQRTSPTGRLHAVFAVGVGETTPPALTGAVDARDGANPDAFRRTCRGGIPVSVASAQLSTNLVGAYELGFVVPELTGDGEVFRRYSGSRRGAGRPHSAVHGRSHRVRFRAATRHERSRPAFRRCKRRARRSGLRLQEPATARLPARHAREPVAWRAAILPLADADAQYCPLEVSKASPVLAALGEPSEGSTASVTDGMLPTDGAAGSVTEVSPDHGADRLQSAPGATSNLRPWQPDSGRLQSVVNFEASMVGKFSGTVALPNPLGVEGLDRPGGPLRLWHYPLAPSRLRPC